MFMCVCACVYIQLKIHQLPLHTHTKIRTHTNTHLPRVLGTLPKEKVLVGRLCRWVGREAGAESRQSGGRSFECRVRLGLLQLLRGLFAAVAEASCGGFALVSQ
jgi:hypothetical protein